MEHAHGTPTKAQFPRWAKRGMGLGLLLVATVALSAQAQRFAPANLSSETFTQEEVSSYDFSRVSSQWWSGASRSVNRDLLGSDEQKMDAMRKIIFLSTLYPASSNFDRSTYKLYHIYRFNRDEHMRVVALAALLASGDDSGMRLVASHDEGFSYAHWDESLRLRRLTAAAVAQHFAAPAIQVGPLMPERSMRR